MICYEQSRFWSDCDCPLTKGSAHLSATTVYSPKGDPCCAGNLGFWAFYRGHCLGACCQGIQVEARCRCHSARDCGNNWKAWGEGSGSHNWDTHYPQYIQGGVGWKDQGGECEEVIPKGCRDYL